MKQSFGVGFLLGIFFIFMVGWVGVEKTKSTITPEQAFRSVQYDYYSAIKLSYLPDSLEIISKIQNAINDVPQYDSLYVIKIPLDGKATYTVVPLDGEIIIFWFHFFSPKSNPKNLTYVIYDNYGEMANTYLNPVAWKN